MIRVKASIDPSEYASVEELMRADRLIPKASRVSHSYGRTLEVELEFEVTS